MTKQEIDEQFRKFKPNIERNLKRIYEVYNFRQSTEEEDTKESFDCCFSNYKNNKTTKVSLRIRNNDAKNFDDITIRSSSQWGKETEYDKLMRLDLTDHILVYCVLNQTNDAIYKMYVIDLNQMKESGVLAKRDGRQRNRNQYDNDYTEFYTFYLHRLIYHNCVIRIWGMEKEIGQWINQKIKEYKEQLINERNENK